MINLPELATRLQAHGLLSKSFQDCTKTEILQVIDAVFSSVGEDVPIEGWREPYLEDTTDGKRLVIPFDSHPRYHWWADGGQSIAETLIYLDAPYEVAKKYWGNLTEEQWKTKLIPF